MKLTFLSGPRKGETTHAEKSQATQLLIDAGLVGVVADAPDMTVRFTIGRTAFSDTPFLQGTLGHRTEVYDGPPEQAQAWFAHVGMKGLQISIVERFITLLAAKKKELSGATSWKQQ